MIDVRDLLYFIRNSESAYGNLEAASVKEYINDNAISIAKYNDLLLEIVKLETKIKTYEEIISKSNFASFVISLNENNSYSEFRKEAERIGVLPKEETNDKD